MLKKKNTSNVCHLPRAISRTDDVLVYCHGRALETVASYYPGQKKKRPLRLCIKSEHCFYHGISKNQAWLRFGVQWCVKSRLAATPCQSPDHADIAWSEQCSDFMHNLSGRFFLSRVGSALPNNRAFGHGWFGIFWLCQQQVTAFPWQKTMMLCFSQEKVHQKIKSGAETSGARGPGK